MKLFLVGCKLHMRKYFKESHKAYSEACQKEVEVISKHPMTEERFREQNRRNREESIRHAKLPFSEPEGTVTADEH